MKQLEINQSRISDYQPFLDSFFEQITAVGLDVTRLPLDHIAYQTSSSAEYDQLKPAFISLSEVIHEEIIGGRRVAVFKLEIGLR